ncbi:hypothetical protein L596_010895 [Steinernema carpocapsae]|uniref:Uncharacterized protein n=1 Tax=Steinernema carpocapsae TaxID=34508 RepID=A0A4U5PME8_STECR|nr:hypothetical protein L596_010895 [Steinernema carpocapsae]
MKTPSVFCGCCRSPKKFKDRQLSPSRIANGIQHKLRRCCGCKTDLSASAATDRTCEKRYEHVWIVLLYYTGCFSSGPLKVDCSIHPCNGTRPRDSHSTNCGFLTPSFHSSPKKLPDLCHGKTPRDVFATARSSTDTTEYQSMAELVRDIRREAGVPETPREAVEEKPRHAVQLNNT